MHKISVNIRCEKWPELDTKSVTFQGSKYLIYDNISRQCGQLYSYHSWGNALGNVHFRDCKYTK